MAVDALSLTFAALSDPTRRAILARLASGGASVKELAEPFDMSSPAISKHLKVLERAGLVEAGRQAQSRPRRLQAGPLQAATAWLEPYRPFWEASFDRLDEYVAELKAARETAGRKKRRSRALPASDRNTPSRKKGKKR